ncbi:YdbL family protein [Parvularcula oceani]|uniref:YdbL family protein n=1 Tax=Parvularcula oceani TaxID=1247963 RepID=UPI0004E0B316|nr:YdbL family protein [Parvularcula oceani]
MKRIISTLAGLFLALSLVPAQAQEGLEQAKADCIIGERIDGYLGVVAGENADAATLRRMREVNQKRAAAYEGLANRNGVTVQAAAKATAERLINSAPSGNCVQNAAGEWIEVP